MVEYNDNSKQTSIDVPDNEKKIEKIRFEPKLDNLRKKVSNIKILSRILSNKIDKQQINNYVVNEKARFQNLKFCKQACITCSKPCKYTLEEIHPSNLILNKSQIKKELKSHKHPQSRRNQETKINYNIEQQKIELYNHYFHHHQ